jgi:hypothetical protein
LAGTCLYEEMDGLLGVQLEHTCLLQTVEKYHRNRTSQFIENEMYGVIVVDISRRSTNMTSHREIEGAREEVWHIRGFI